MITRFESLPECQFGLDGGAMFGIVPKPLWERSNPADDANRIEMTTRCLYLETADRRVLVDTGMGDKWTEKEAQIYAVARPDGSLRTQLGAIGVDPDTITDVVLTHLHFDHAGGLTTRDASGELHATFPDATHHVQRENWVWAHHPSRRDAGSYRRENFSLLGGPGGPSLELHDGVTTLFDAIELIPCHGHTPGMQILKFDVDGQTVVYLADLIPTLGHLQLAWVMGYDLHPLVTVREKHEVLENAIRNDWTLAVEHDPHHGFARIERAGVDRYRVAARSATLDTLDRSTSD